jgi:hypothetical protein
MDNISFCINGSVEVPPSFVRFGANDIATILLPKLHELLSIVVGPGAPTQLFWQFSQEIVSSPAMAKALALNNQCPTLANYLVQLNGSISALAISSFRQMIKLDSTTVKKAYEALETAIDQVPDSTPPHPSVKFFVEISPRIVEDCLNNNLFKKVAPLINHKIGAIRQSVLPKIIYEAQSSDRVRQGLVKAHTLRLLQDYYKDLHPPPDTIEFLTAFLPLTAHKMCRHLDDVNWLLEQLANPNTKITSSIIEALRISSRKEDHLVYDNFVKADVLHRLDQPPTQASLDVTKLICDLLPVLAVSHAKSKTCARVVYYLDHAEGTVTRACVAACKRIVDSTPEDRSTLFSELRKLDLARESTLELLDYILPVLFKDHVNSGDFEFVSKMVLDPEPRVRVHAHQVCRDVLYNTPDARTSIPIDRVFQLCGSGNEDCVILGSQLLPTMAIEIIKAGPMATRSLLDLLHHPWGEMRQAALRSIQIISDSSDANRETLHVAGTFSMLKHNLTEHPLDGIDIVQGIFINLVPYLSHSRDACCGLLELLT